MMMMMRLPLPLLGLLVAVWSTAILVAHAHPGGVANGRATCGTEYSTPDTAYLIPDVREAWYLRRIATCESPVFWTQFEITESSAQPLYIAVISPELERFEDQLHFHGILYGPELTPSDNNGLSSIPTDLPLGIVPESTLGGAGYLTSPAALDTCDFVDANVVMEQFSDVQNGRCMEEFTLSSTFEDPLQQTTTSYSWWLYSFNHTAAAPGTYYLQTWLTHPDDPQVSVEGKYEMTLGPWTWSGYASDTTLESAQQQGTTCSCAVNALDYKEHYVERLGDLDASYHVAALPGKTCASSNDTSSLPSPCVTTPETDYISDQEAVEWSGMFTLQAGRTYEWTFHAYYQGTPNGFNNDYGYPDPGMLVVALPLEDGQTVTSVAVSADATLSSILAQEMDTDVPIVKNGELLLEPVSFVEFADTTVSNSTTVLLQPEQDVRLAVFTQHVPSEFMAHVLRDADSGEYIFPTMTTLYAHSSGNDTGGTIAEEDESTGDDDVDVEPGGVEGTTAPVSAAMSEPAVNNFVVFASATACVLLFN